MSRPGPFEQRASGILLHPTSLPGTHGVGDLGPAAHDFIDFLGDAGQRWWQMLPIGPPGGGNSPYDSPSAFAGSPLLISLDALTRDGLLRPAEIRPSHTLARARRSHYEAAARFRLPLLERAFERFDYKKSRDFQEFRARSKAWLDDYALFSALRVAHRGKPWFSWDESLARRQRPALERARRELEGRVRFFQFLQYAFDRQWTALREHAARRGILLLGDTPMFVAHDGADVWAHQDLFFLDRKGHRTVLAGVPPDPFSKDGQLWGNPLYRWKTLERANFSWWVNRLAVSLERFDAVRIDHFIGLHRCWEVKSGQKTAIAGRFVRVPGASLLEQTRKALGSLPFVAEDLGLITQEVRELRDAFELPGMAVLQFGFGDGGTGKEHEPHRYVKRLVAYTGTHDNDTFIGWLRARPQRGVTNAELDMMKRVRTRMRTYLGASDSEIHWHAIRALLVSVANTVVFPLQDVLGLGSEARMNVPGVATGNWTWRVERERLTAATAARMANLCAVAERTTHVSRQRRQRS